MSEHDAWFEYLHITHNRQVPVDENGKCEACHTIDGHLVVCPQRYGYRGIEPWAWARLNRRLLANHKIAA